MRAAGGPLPYHSPMSHRASALVALCVLAGSVAVVIGQSSPAQQALTPAARWQRAVDAWEAGAYPAALEDLRTLMRSPAAPDYFDRVALLTGELYVTTVLTTEGSLPRISPNGSYASYQPAVTNNQPITTIVRLGPRPETVAELPTSLLAFDNAGRRVAYLRYITTGDPGASEIVVRDLATGQDTVWLGTGMQKSELAWSPDDQSVIFLGSPVPAGDRTDAYRVRAGSGARGTDARAGSQIPTAPRFRGQDARVQGIRRRANGRPRRGGRGGRRRARGRHWGADGWRRRTRGWTRRWSAR